MRSTPNTNMHVYLAAPGEIVYEFENFDPEQQDYRMLVAGAAVIIHSAAAMQSAAIIQQVGLATAVGF